MIGRVGRSKEKQRRVDKIDGTDGVGKAGDKGREELIGRRLCPLLGVGMVSAVLLW
jgi:hypothetical protein